MKNLRRKFIFCLLFFFTLGVFTWILNHTNISAWAQTKIQAADFAPGQLEAHFLKHGYQFGDITEDDYLQDARDLLNALPGDDVLEKIRPNGDIEHYRVSSGEFAVMTKRGRIRTYFKTDERYWYKQ